MQESNPVAGLRDRREAQPDRHRRALWRDGAGVAAALACLALAACATRPLIPYSADTPPLALVAATQAGIQDKQRDSARSTVGPGNTRRRA